MAKLPDADELFARFFAPWYDEEDLERHGTEGCLPDLEQIEAPGKHADDLSLLVPAIRTDVVKTISAIAESARNDWPRVMPVKGTVAMEWVEAFDRFWGRGAVRDILERSDPADPANEYVVLTCQLGAVIAEAFLQERPGLELLCAWPYWDSALFEPGAGYRINVFHWALRRMSETGFDDGLARKVQTCLRYMRHRP